MFQNRGTISWDVIPGIQALDDWVTLKVFFMPEFLAF